jgi:cytoskeletal protein CcmA (bactofilin family)
LTSGKGRIRTASSVISVADLPLCDSEIGPRDSNFLKAKDFRPTAWGGARNALRGEPRKVAPMLQSADNSYKSNTPSSNPNPTPGRPIGAPTEQATIGRTLVIKGEVSGSESLYIDGRIEGKVNVPDNRVTIGRNGTVQANITAREVVVMGKVNGNIECSDRVDIRSEGSVTGDVATQRISVEDGAILKGGIQVRSAELKHEKGQADWPAKSAETPKPAVHDGQKGLAITVGA